MRHNQIIFKEQYKEIADKYLSGKTISRLALEYNVSVSPIKYALKKLGIKIRSPQEDAQKHTVDSDFFKVINTEEKAYFLGLLYADGYVTIHKNGTRAPCSGICLSGEEERQLLEKFKKACRFTGPIMIKKWGKLSTKQPYVIQIIDKVFRQNLINNGCVQRKSLILDFPSFEIIPEHLFHHFIRGFWDGDGSISLLKKKLEISISAKTSIIFAQKFCSLMKKDLDINFFSYFHKKSMCVTLGGQVGPVKFLNYIYKDATIFLNRKKKNFDNFINIYKDNAKNYDFLKIRRKETLEQLGKLLNIDFIESFKTDLNKEERDKVRRLYKNKKSIYRISKTMKISVGKITRFLQSEGFKTGRERLGKYTGKYAKIPRKDRKKFQKEPEPQNNT